MPFRWTLNPYRGCAFACRYCYARYTHEWLGLDPDRGFEEQVLVKQDVATVLERDLARLRHRGQVGEPIAIGTATDPYQPLEHRYGLTRACLEVFRREEGHRLSITTKSDLIVRDVELIREVSRNNPLRVHVTVTTLNRELARLLEPAAPSPRARLAAIATLVDAGVSVDAFVMPILPGINDADEDLDELFATLAGVGVRTAICEALFLRSPSKEIFFRFLREHMPEFEAEYRRRYDESAYATPLYVEKLRARVQKLRQKWNLLGPGSHRLAGPSVRITMPRRRQKRLPRERPPSSRLFDQLRLFD